MKRLAAQLKEHEELKNGIIIVGIIIGIYIGIRYFLPILIPFLVAFLIAGLLRPVVDWLVCKSHCSEKWAALLVLIITAGLLGIIGHYTLRTLYGQIADFVIYLPFYKEQFMAGLGSCCSYIDTGLHLEAGASLTYATETLAGVFTDFQTSVLPRLTSRTVAVFKQAFSSVLFLFIMLYATLCILKDYPRIIRTGILAGKVQRGWEHVTRLLGAYLRAETTIAILQAIICSIGLRILGNPYFIIMAVLIGIIDALPVLGSGTILIPWAVCQFLMGNVRTGIGLVVLYLLCTLNRQLLEPRLLGQRLGMSTLVTLFFMYIGYRLFGIFGFILGPVGYLVGREIYQQVKEKSCN